MTTTRTTHRSTKPKRYEYHVTYDASTRTWVCKLGGAVVDYATDRNFVIARAAADLSRIHDLFGQHSELLIHTKRGTIGKGPSSRRTYGGDDPKSKG